MAILEIKNTLILNDEITVISGNKELKGIIQAIEYNFDKGIILIKLIDKKRKSEHNKCQKKQ